MSEQIQSINDIYKKGQPIQVGRKFGIVTEIRHNYVYFVRHNGMKPVHDFATVDKIKPLTKEKFNQYIARSGCTALLGYLNT